MALENKEFVPPPPDARTIHLLFHRICQPEFMTGVSKELAELERNIRVCDSWSQLTELIKLRPKSICFHSNELNYSSAVEIVNMVHTLTKLVNLDYEITVTVSVDKTVDYSTIKELQKSGIFGIIPNHLVFGWDEAVKGLTAQWANIPYWPKHIIDQLPGAKVDKTKPNTTEIKLTPRQTQILNLVLERGSSNKIIARTLNISESTVKLHLGHIFKKYGVKNRTQLAVFAAKK